MDKYQDIFNAIPQSLFTWQIQGDEFVLIDYNTAALRFSGEGLKELIGSKASILYKNDPDILLDFNRCKNTKSTFDREMIYGLRTSGDQKVVAVKYTYIAPDLILVQSEEITKRKKEETILSENNEILASFIKDSPAALSMVDNDMRYIAASNKWIVDYQLDPNSLIGKTHYEIFPEIPQEWKDIHSHCLKGHIQKRDEDSFTRLDGTTLWLRWEIHPWHKASGEIGGILMFTEDITKRKNSEMERNRITDDLIQRNRDLEQFSYIISHNLRAPVSNILGISELLFDSDLDLDQVQKMNQGLHQSVKSLDQVIKDLVYILQTKREINEQKVDVKFIDIVEDIKTSIQSLILKERVEFLVDFSACEGINTIKSYMYSIFYNLITNSVKYKKPNTTPTIHIKSWKTKESIVVSFQDNGLGIDLEKKREEIFGLYKRFHFHTEGRGLGLYMVRTQVESLGGKISIESELDKGTKFEIEF